MDRENALKIAEDFLQDSVSVGEPPMAIDREQVSEKDGILIVPYNSVEFLRTRSSRDRLLDCWPMLVNLATGSVRFGRLEERDFWN